LGELPTKLVVLSLNIPVMANLQVAESLEILGIIEINLNQLFCELDGQSDWIMTF
jgi:hypothetical protein